MAKKDRTLYVLKYLWKNTDEDHPATVSDILAALEAENIKVERHALMSDIEQLTEFGIAKWSRAQNNVSFLRSQMAKVNHRALSRLRKAAALSASYMIWRAYTKRRN